MRATSLVFLTLFTNLFTADSATLTSPFVSGFGNSSSGLPLTFPSHYQQVYQGGDFLGAMPQGGLISQLAFRPEETLSGVAEGDISSIRLSLSTTQKAMGGLSAVFSENVGSDEMAVFGPRSIALQNSPDQFSFLFSFQTPFFYDPRAGNLLLDVRNLSGATIPMFASPPVVDALQGGTISSVYNVSVDALSGTLDTESAITQFTFTAVPEPSPLHICLGTLFAGFAMFAFKRWKTVKMS